MKLKLINSLTRNRRWRRLSWKKSRDKSEHSSHWWEKNIIKIWFLLKNIPDFLFIVKNISHHKCFYSLSRIFLITNISVLTAESKNHFDLIYCFPSTFVKNTSSPYSNVTTVFYIFFKLDMSWSFYSNKTHSSTILSNNMFDCFQTQVWAALVVWDTVSPPPPLLFHRRLQIVHLQGGTLLKLKLLA